MLLPDSSTSYMLRSLEPMYGIKNMFNSVDLDSVELWIPSKRYVEMYICMGYQTIPPHQDIPLTCLYLYISCGLMLYLCNTLFKNTISYNNVMIENVNNDNIVIMYNKYDYIKITFNPLNFNFTYRLNSICLHYYIYELYTIVLNYQCYVLTTLDCFRSHYIVAHEQQ